jgi:hypothetical protein
MNTARLRVRKVVIMIIKLMLKDKVRNISTKNSIIFEMKEVLFRRRVMSG